MKKQLNKPTAEARPINGTQYIILSDLRVARLLTPTIRNGQTFYNLFIDGKYTRSTVESLTASADIKRS